MTRQSRIIIYGLVAVGAYLLWKQMQAKTVAGLGYSDYREHGLGDSRRAMLSMQTFPGYTGSQRHVGRAAA
jgi:hypothetical protein